MPSLDNASITPATTSTLPPDIPSTAMTASTSNRTSQMPIQYSLGLPRTNIPSTPNPDEDPNAGRRKRRKTERSKQPEHDQPLQAGLSGWLGVEPPASIAPKLPPVDGVFSTSSMPPPPALVEPQPASMSTENEPAPKNTTPVQDTPTRPQKIVKLNTNGRLLSSPPLSPAGTSAPKRASRKRGQDPKTGSIMVVIKYAPAEKADVGRIIDDILSGRVKHNAVSPFIVAPVRRPLQPKANDNKPTHPFFVKKAPSKPPTVGSCDRQSTPKSLDINAHSEGEQSKIVEAKGELKSLRALSSGFVRRTNKFPELVHPLWPPRELIHVSDLSPDRLARASISNFENDHKKSKSPTVVVPDAENVLLTSTERARKVAAQELQSANKYKPALRLPGRHIASGRVLQAALDSQMSWSLPGQRSSCASSLPVIKKLHSSLITSVSAFDCGKYESRLWAHKYSPAKAEDVLQVGREARMLRDWLCHLKVSAVDSGKQPKDSAKLNAKRDKRRKKRKVDAELDGFIVSSGEEASEMDALSGSDDELAGDVTVSAPKTLIRTGDLAFQDQRGGEKCRLANVILISGPPGCGKTASVYAVAKELDFEVFEINPGSRRSARDMLEKVGDMTQNHLVHLLNDKDDSMPRLDQVANVDGKQNKLMSFFKGQPSRNENSKSTNGAKANSGPAPEAEGKKGRQQKQSLILLEEADLLFEEDRHFWTGVLTLISQSKRPIIITCNDETVVPIQDMSLHAILRYQLPPIDLALDYLLLIAAHEGHALKRDAVDKLYNASGRDIRRSLMELNFWCQMAVGSEKGGLDWILPTWPPGANVDQNGERVRVLSLNTYQSYMGWFNRDTFLGADPLVKETQALENIFHWWQLSVQDAEDAAGASAMERLPSQQHRDMTKLEQLELLSREADYLEMRSSLDILCSNCPMGTFEDVLDTSAPLMSESHRTNYTDAHLLLQADLLPEYSSLSQSISTTFDSLISRVFRPEAEDIESASARRIFNGWAQSAARQSLSPSTARGFRKVFEPIMRANYSTALAVGRAAPSFENGLAPIAEDIAPYVRAIMVFDGRLKQYRDNLFAVWSQGQGGGGGGGDKRMRKTRASRAALEGGNKASTRKERWFPDDLNYYGILSTGRPEWQQILYDMGHFHVEPVTESAGRTSESRPDDQA
ncbi:Telomere length regulation protein elg1 [Penicillium rolfsii]|nr:Telomere length regulation protein elg1 [Penicillium rolfsii]